MPARGQLRPSGMRAVNDGFGARRPSSTRRPSVQQGTGNGQPPVELDHPLIWMRTQVAACYVTWIVCCCRRADGARQPGGWRIAAVSVRTAYVHPTRCRCVGATMRRKWRPASHSRSPPLLARSPSSRNARIGQRFHSRSGLIRLAPRFPIVRNRTACSLFHCHGPHPREPDAPGATRGLPPTCPRMASPA